MLVQRHQGLKVATTEVALEGILISVKSQFCRLEIRIVRPCQKLPCKDAIWIPESYCIVQLLSVEGGSGAGALFQMVNQDRGVRILLNTEWAR